VSTAFPTATHALRTSLFPKSIATYRHYLLLPTLLTIAACVLLMGLGGDFWLADRIYHWGGQQWLLQDAWWTSSLMHRGGKNLSAAAAVCVLALLLYSRTKHHLIFLRKPLAYLLVTVVLSPSLVSALKHLTQLDCPWDLQRYGGLHPFIALFQTRPAELAQAMCFPAGHASAGYAWLGLYFFALQTAPKWRWHALVIALATGLAFGVTQQLRGAHFLSHDLVSLWLCWVVAVVLHEAMFPGTPTQPQSNAGERT
jgi:membrane-associated PAP2 superfamily phosphatase